MTHIKPKAREDLPELAPLFDLVEQTMGFVPESMTTMAHWPELLGAFGGLGATVLNSGEVDAVITLGAVIRGETPHFDIIANECARGIGSIAIETAVPVVFGVPKASRPTPA